MADQIIMAKRINNGQSEIWIEGAETSRRVVATNSIVYPVRTLCSKEDAETFHQELAVAAAAIPPPVASKLKLELGL